MEERIAEIERRLAELEDSPCDDGHDFVQGAGPLQSILFCTRCGQVRELTVVQRRIGFDQQDRNEE